MSPHRYSDAEITAIERAIRERRDMRHFLPDPLPAGLLERLVAAAHLAPSVGYMQPWRFILNSSVTPIPKPDKAKSNREAKGILAWPR